MASPKVPYSKPSLSVEQQIQLLEDRGLLIDDQDRANHYLSYIGYYRLSGYSRYFLGKGDRFVDGIDFDKVLDLYVFDRKIRVLIQDALERIEVAIKAALSNVGSDIGGPFWMCDPAHFDRGKHKSVLDILDGALEEKNGSDRHLFLSHFRQKYTDERPPSWMVMEALSFGAVSKTFGVSRGSIQTATSKLFCVHRSILESWLHCLVYIRNLCAHHCRTWNRRFTIIPRIPNQDYLEWQPLGSVKLYTIARIINDLMHVIADGSAWNVRLRDLIRERPGVPLSAMGFPEDWEDNSAWRYEVGS